MVEQLRWRWTMVVKRRFSFAKYYSTSFAGIREERMRCMQFDTACA
jgi:hypothetical protein